MARKIAPSTRWVWFAALLCVMTVAICLLAFDSPEPTVRVEPPNAVGPRVLEDQTRAAVVRDYLKAWQSMNAALGQNRPDLLDADFVGIAKDKLSETIREEEKAGIQASYSDKSHDISLTFYSLEGLSIQLADKVEYDVEVKDDGKPQGTQHVRCRYIAVLTPTEVRWKVRIFQAAP